MIYLDNAATSFPKPPQVLAAVNGTMQFAGANPGRAGHRLSLAAGRIVLRAREALAQLMQVENPDNIVFGYNCTDALNLAIKGIVRPGWEVATTVWEHNSVLRPLNELARTGVITLRTADTIDQAVTRQTSLVVVTHASNVTGMITPIEQVAALCQMRGIHLLVDAAQTMGILPLYPEQWGIDLVAMPGHKGLYGPQGTGALYIRPGLTLTPLREGGTGTSSDSVLQPTERPERYEGGTLNTPGLAGLAKGVEYVLENRARLHAQEMLLTDMLLEGLLSIQKVKIYGSKDAVSRIGTVSFNVGALSSGEVADQLNTLGICVRSGLHCAPWAHTALGTLEQGAVRASLGGFNTLEDVQALLSAVRYIAHHFA